MPIGVYIRTRPLSKRQLEALERLHNLPKTQKQIEAARRNGRKVGLTASWNKGLSKDIDSRVADNGKAITEGKLCSLKSLEASRKNARKMGLNGPHVSANDIIKHHNDLCHGALRPNDVTYMTHSEHTTLHLNLRVKDGSHPFLAKNKV